MGLKGYNLFEVALIGIVAVISALFMAQSFAQGDFILSTIDTIAAICGMFSVVLCAKGRKSGFLFGLVNVVFYSIISYMNSYYGEVMLNVLFYIPMNVMSWFLWKKKEDLDGIVEAKALTAFQMAVAALLIVITTVIYKQLLAYLGGEMTMLDGATTILSIFATVLMYRRYAEQWACWFVIDIMTTIMWVVAANWVMVAMWAAYTVNALYGWVIWLSRSGRIHSKLAARIAAASE